MHWRFAISYHTNNNSKHTQTPSRSSIALYAFISQLLPVSEASNGCTSSCTLYVVQPQRQTARHWCSHRLHASLCVCVTRGQGTGFAWLAERLSSADSRFWSCAFHMVTNTVSGLTSSRRSERMHACTCNINNWLYFTYIYMHFSSTVSCILYIVFFFLEFHFI